MGSNIHFNILFCVYNSCSKTNSAELSLRFVSNHKLNSTQISREYDISGLSLSLSLRFVSNHHPMCLWCASSALAQF